MKDLDLNRGCPFALYNGPYGSIHWTSVIFGKSFSDIDTMLSIYVWHLFFTKLHVICKKYCTKILCTIYAQYFIQDLFLFYVVASSSV